MTKTSIQISSDSNNKIEILKKTLSDTGKYLEDSNLYIKHLENRIVSLENKQVTETVSHNSGENNGSVTVTEEGTSANSDLLPQPLQQLTSTSNNPDTEWEIFYFNDFFSPTDEQEHTHESGNSHTAPEADPDTDPSTPTSTSSMSSSEATANYGLLEAGLNLYPVMTKNTKVDSSLHIGSNHSYCKSWLKESSLKH